MPTYKSKYLYDSAILSHPIGEFYGLKLELFKNGTAIKSFCGERINFDINKEMICFFALEYGAQHTSPKKGNLLFSVHMGDVGRFEEIPFNEDANREYEKKKRLKELEAMNERQREYEVEMARTSEKVTLDGVIFKYMTDGEKKDRIDKITFETILAQYQ